MLLGSLGQIGELLFGLREYHPTIRLCVVVMAVVIGGMVMVNMAKVLVIERPRVPKIPISLRFVCFMLCISTMALAKETTWNFILLRPLDESLTERVEIYLFFQ